MEYPQFELDFVHRTKALLEQYDAHVLPAVDVPARYEVTLLINCLLGLIVLPKELLSAKIPAEPEDRFGAWGLPAGTIRRWEHVKGGSHQPRTLSQLIRRLRNASCHLRIETESQDGEISALRFNDENGFDAVISVTCLRIFVLRLTDVLLAA
jgi:hypothetical protein